MEGQVGVEGARLGDVGAASREGLAGAEVGYKG